MDVLARTRKTMQAALWILGLLALAPLARAQNAIEAFEVAHQAGQIVIKVTLKDALTQAPGSFTVANPARIAIDFPGTINALGRNSQNVGEGDLRSMNVVQAGDRTRLVLNLRNMMQYDTKIDGRNVVVTLSPGTTATAQAGGAPVSRFAEGRTDVTHQIKDINFRRGRNGEGRIVVDLSDTSTGVDIRQQGQSLIVDFLKSNLPDALRRRLDVVDFATPVQTVSAFAQGDNVRLLIEPKGLWEHNAYQTDTQFVLEVKPVQYDPNKLVQGTRGGYTGEKLSLNFQNVEVRSVLNVIADFTDLNIITSDSVGGNLTLRLKDVPWDQALDIILQTRGLDMRKNGNVIWIAPRDELATKEKLTLESQQQITELEPLRTENFQLNYAKAADIARLLSDPAQKMLSKRGSAVVDARTNQLFVQDVPSRLDDVRRLLVKVDVPVRQVLIEARIVEANDTFSKNLGVRLGYNQFFLQGGTRVGGQDNVRANVGAELQNTGQSTLVFPPGATGAPVTTPIQMVQGTPVLGGPGQQVNLPSPGLSGFSPGQFSVILFNSTFTKFLNLELSALESEGKGKIISSPRVLTADNIEALIEQGTELPYQIATSSGATALAFRKANLALKVKPQITPDGNIIMGLDVNKDAVGQTTTFGFAIDTKHVKTEVLVENGGTVVIGGIYTQDARVQTVKIPFFGDLPLIGFLFRNVQRADNKTELLVFMTPRIVEERLLGVR
jgi:type IV pilus assembly protein PilQ